MLLGWGCGVWLEKLIHQVITGGGSCGISGCPSVEEEEDGERFPKEDQCSAASPTHPYPPPRLFPLCFSSDGSPCDYYYSPFFLSSITSTSTLSAPSITSSIPLQFSISHSLQCTHHTHHTHYTHHPPTRFSVRPSLSSFFTFLLGGSP